MTPSVESPQIVPPVDVAPGAGGPYGQAGRGAINPAALTVEQLARAIGLPVETVRRHVEEGAPAGPDGRMNLIHYSAWLNKRLGEANGD
jgi:hypothetical protein